MNSETCLEEVFPPVSLKLVPIGLDNVKEHRKTSRPHVQLAPGKFDQLNFAFNNNQTTAPANNARELEEDWEPAFDPDPVHVRNVPGLLNLGGKLEISLTYCPKATVVIAQASVVVAQT